MPLKKKPNQIIGTRPEVWVRFDELSTKPEVWVRNIKFS